MTGRRAGTLRPRALSWARLPIYLKTNTFYDFNGENAIHSMIGLDGEQAQDTRIPANPQSPERSSAPLGRRLGQPFAYGPVRPGEVAGGPDPGDHPARRRTVRRPWIGDRGGGR